MYTFLYISDVHRICNSRDLRCLSNYKSKRCYDIVNIDTVIFLIFFKPFNIYIICNLL